MTGISVVPVPMWTAPTLATQAATVSELSGGRFVLGVGPSFITDPGARRMYGVAAVPPLALMRDWVTVLKRLFAGEKVEHDSASMSLHGVSLAFRDPQHVPVYLAAMGPRMLRLAGELADGAMPNWASPEQLAWCREHIDAGARRAGRDPTQVALAQYIRVCIDKDVAAARHAYAENLLGYALARPGVDKSLGYRAHFGRMGFDGVLSELEARRDAGTPMHELADRLPDDLLYRVGYFGAPSGAPAEFRRLMQGLDEAIVRVITTRPDIDRVRLALRTLAPSNL
jgi:alkanesulfonate monooxygenase SsuD/methylene tetrahydromethanopterin reductase-like flavin-dependent oxidoreductase (luciferase family)